MSRKMNIDENQKTIIEDWIIDAKMLFKQSQ